MVQTASWVVSLKQSLVEQKGPKIGPFGLHIKRSNAEYGQEAQTGGHMVQAESWVISRKRSVMERNRQKFGPSGLYEYTANAKYGKNRKSHG